MSKREISHYSVASLSFFEYNKDLTLGDTKYKGKYIASVENVQNVEIGLSTDLVAQSTGGILKYANDVRTGNSSGEFSCELNQVTPVLLEYIFGGKLTVSASQDASVTGTHITGNSVPQTSITVSVDDADEVRDEILILIADSTDKASLYSSRKSEPVLVVDKSATSIKYNGIEITRSSGDFTAGDEARFVCKQKGGEKVEFVVNELNKGSDVSIRIDGVNKDGALFTHDIFRVRFPGQSMSITADEFVKFPLSGGMLLSTPTNEIARKLILS